MHCPVCPGVEMRQVERTDLVYERCPRCRGAWIEDIEIERLVQRSDAIAARSALEPRDDDSSRRYHRSEAGQRRRRSWLSDFFD